MQRWTLPKVCCKGHAEGQGKGTKVGKQSVFVTILSSARRRWHMPPTPPQIVALAMLGIFVIAAFAFTANASAQSATATSRMGGMMSSYTTSQNFTAECNQMAASYGLNGTVIADMNKLMSSRGMSQMMSSGMMSMMQSDRMMH